MHLLVGKQKSVSPKRQGRSYVDYMHLICGGYIMHQSLDIVLVITLATVFIIMLAGIVSLCIYNCRCRKAVIKRLEELRINRMLGHLGIDRKKYLRKATPLTVEKHLYVCARCKTTDLCDECLINGKDIPEDTFCRNFPELERYR